MKYLKNIYTDYTVKHDAIHLGSIFFGNIIENGEVREIEAVSFRKVQDRASSNEEKIKVTMSYGVSKRGGFLRAITNIIRDRSSAIMEAGVASSLSQELVTNVKKLLSISLPEDETISELSATIVCNGTSRKIDLGNIYKFATRYDVTHLVKMGKDKHPLFESINNAVKDILENDIRSLIRG